MNNTATAYPNHHHQQQQPANASEAVAVAAVAAQRRMIIKNKVIAIGRLSRQLAVLRANEDAVKEIKRTSTTGKLPVGTLAHAVRHQQGLQVST